jgi:hypothetical protein
MIRVWEGWWKQLGAWRLGVARDRQSSSAAPEGLRTGRAAAPPTQPAFGSVDQPRYRYERKFCWDGVTFHEVESVLLLHPAMFREIYHERWVNNIYLDSLGLRQFQAAVAGHGERAKARVRWYGPLFGTVSAAKLEIKRKSGMVGAKQLFPLASFVLDARFDHATLSEVFQRSIPSAAILTQLSDLEPALLNRYRRRYYQSADGRLRVTIDTDLEYRPVDRRGNTWSTVREDTASTILEIKYDAEDEHRLDELIGHFPLRVTKKSKYVSGIMAVW